MNAPRSPRTLQRPPAVVALTLLLLTAPAAVAGPGAHGPNGEHLDAPATVRAALALPRLEAHTDAFELVAELRAGALVVVIDRYASNEPVLGAKLEVDSGSLKAAAAFRAEQGDYVVTDEALLKALTAPGEHGLVFTLLAGTDSDLLDGTLARSAARNGAAQATQHDHDHDHAHGHGDHGHSHGFGRKAWAGIGAAALCLMGGVVWWRQRRTGASKPQGGV